MRFFEVATAPLQVLAAPRLFKQLGDYVRANPTQGDEIVRLLSDFVTAKVVDPTRPFNRKDISFSGSVLKGYMHVHLVHGRCILVYQIRAGILRMFSIGDHSTYGGNAEASLGKYIKSLGDDQMRGFAPKPKTSVSAILSPEQKGEVQELFEWILGSDPDIFRTALRGDLSELLGYACEATGSDQQTVLRSFGGADALLTQLKTMARNSGVS